jgi:hypothetical protein
VAEDAAELTRQREMREHGAVFAHLNSLAIPQ